MVSLIVIEEFDVPLTVGGVRRFVGLTRGSPVGQASFREKEN
jgi:hypothetical protein